MRITKFLVFTVMIMTLMGQAFSFESSSYPYYKKVSGNANEPAIIVLDSQVLDHMKKDGSDLRVLVGGKEVPLKVFTTQEEELAHGSEIIQYSSTRTDFRGVSFSASNIIDGDYSSNDNAYYQSDSIKDPIFSWFILDLKNPKLTDHLKIWSLNEDYTWKEVQIEGSNDLSKFDIIKKKTEFSTSIERTVKYPPVEFRYLKITLWHTQSLVVNEIEIYGAYSGYILFSAKSGSDTRLYYGNIQASASQYDTSSLFTKQTTPKLSLGFQIENADYSTDTDSDGIVKDNCASQSNQDQKDSDNDKVGDACDNCPSSANFNQADSDNDKIGDACDNCISDYNPDQYDDNLNGKGYACDDNDADGVRNSVDNCISVKNSDQSDKDRNSVGDACEDADGDGIGTGSDNCLNKNNPDQKDTDKDRIGDACDNCLLGYNPTQFDKNQNSIGDVCEDNDKDSSPNYIDNCEVPNPDQKDSDSDNLGDACDNCPNVKNPEQSDSDNNKIGDICDDQDGDGLINPRDNCPSVSNKDQKDQNNNEVGDACEDFDSDGVQNHEDNCIYEYNPKQTFGSSYMQRDSDKDGKGDACDSADQRFTENKGLIWGVLGATILIVGFLAFRLMKTGPKKVQ